MLTCNRLAASLCLLEVTSALFQGQLNRQGSQRFAIWPMETINTSMSITQMTKPQHFISNKSSKEARRHHKSRVSQGFKFRKFERFVLTHETKRWRFRLVPQGIMESRSKARSRENLNIRTRELGFMVLQWQDHEVKTLRGGGSFRCC